MTNSKHSNRLAVLVLLCSLGVSAVTLRASESKPSSAAPRRISSKLIDLGKVYPIYMVAGMATLIEFPGPVSGIRTGNPDSIQYFRPDKPENEVTIVLQNQNAKPTNLIVRTGKKKYVFDIVPSKTVHQDALEVIGDYGGAEVDDSNVELIDSSDKPRGKEVKK